MIHDIILTPLNIYEDEKGKVLHMIREQKEILGSIGEVYFSVVFPNQIKAWKQHQIQTQRLTVPSGDLLFVLYDGRKDSPTYQLVQEVRINAQQYQLLIIPPKIWYGFQCLSPTDAVIANCPDLAHDPSEVRRLDLDQDIVPYQWTK